MVTRESGEEKKNSCSIKTMESQMCGSQYSRSISFAFWALVNVSFLITSVAFIFFPKEAVSLLNVFSYVTVTDCWKHSSNLALIDATDVGCNNLSVDHFNMVRDLGRGLGFVWLYAAAGTNQMLSDAWTYTHVPTKRFVYSLTTLYYAASAIGLLWLVSAQRFFVEDGVTMTVQILISLYIAALTLGLLGTVVASFSSFVEILPNVLEQKKTVPVSITRAMPPASRSAMTSV